jgi:hypothetical protein
MRHLYKESPSSALRGGNAPFPALSADNVTPHPATIIIPESLLNCADGNCYAGKGRIQALRDTPSGPGPSRYTCRMSSETRSRPPCLTRSHTLYTRVLESGRCKVCDSRRYLAAIDWPLRGAVTRLHAMLTPRSWLTSFQEPAL